MSYIRIRHILGAPGKKHKYVSQSYAINAETGIITAHSPQEISIAATYVRMKETYCPKWEIQEEGCGIGFFLLTEERLNENVILSQLIQTNGGLYGEQEDKT